MNISLPQADGSLSLYELSGEPLTRTPLNPQSARIVFAAAHVVADPLATADPGGTPVLDWQATLAFRHHLASLGLGIAEAMDTAQRGMGLDWTAALELIKRTRAELPDALVFNGCGTDQLNPDHVRNLDQVIAAYAEQIEAVQKIGGRVIVMASRALARVAQSPDDYIHVYEKVLAVCDQPVILHWLGDMFDPALRGYWGSEDFSISMPAALAVISKNTSKVDGIKLSLLDKQKEIDMRTQLPAGVRMYTGDDFNYPELIEGDKSGYSDALLGVFDPLAVAAAYAITGLTKNNTTQFRDTLEPTVPLARLLFRDPTYNYKTGVVFLAWLAGHQQHFIMVNGAQSARSLADFVDLFKMADRCGLFPDPELAVYRMRNLLSMYGCAV